MKKLYVRWDDRGKLIVQNSPDQLYRRLNDSAWNSLQTRDPSEFDDAIRRVVGIMPTLPRLRRDALRKYISLLGYFYFGNPAMISGLSTPPASGGTRAA